MKREFLNDALTKIFRLIQGPALRPDFCCLQCTGIRTLQIIQKMHQEIWELAETEFFHFKMANCSKYIPNLSIKRTLGSK